MGYGGLRLMPSTPVYLRILFRDAIDSCLSMEGVNSKPVTDHIAEGLFRGIRSEGFFYIAEGRRLETPAEMMEFAGSLHQMGDAGEEFNALVGMGDYTLFLLGMFPRSRHVVNIGPVLYSDYGRYCYRRAGEIDADVFGHSGERFEALADFFPSSVRAVRRMMAGELKRADESMLSWVPLVMELGLP